MRYRRFEPLDRDVSVLVLGTASYEHAPPDCSLELLDAWRDLGGNAVDTARQYGNAEAILGRWFRERGCRDGIVLVGKGGHYDEETGRQRVTDADVEADLAESLATLEVERIDLYLLHRDDPSRPAAEIVDHLEALQSSGRIRTFGGSNWATGRLEEAGMRLACSSPGLSLAVPNGEPWPGCVTIHDPESLAWYERTQLPVLAWSSQAGGFFAEAREAAPYLNEANGERRRRAEQLGREKGFSANQLALAWVLRRPFPVYALIGPATVEELHDSLGALEVGLTDEEARWLDLE